MRPRTYSDEEKNTVETTLDDEEIIKAFMHELGVEDSALKLLDAGKSSQPVRAEVTYDLVHPYDGDRFMEYATLREEVTAYVELSVYRGEQVDMYSGLLTEDATQIFSPEKIVS